MRKLTRDEMEMIMGGDGDGPCCVHMRDSDTGAYLGKTCGHSVSDAQDWYNNQDVTEDGTQYVSGYCCASC